MNSELEIADTIRQAATSKTPLELTAGGTRRALGRPVQAAQTLSLAGLTKVTLYEPGELTLVVQAGTTIARCWRLKESRRLAARLPLPRLAPDVCVRARRGTPYSVFVTSMDKAKCCVLADG